MTRARAGYGYIWLRLISGSGDFDLVSCSCCPSDKKVDDPDDSARFPTDAGVKVGRGSRRANEQADFNVRDEAGSAGAASPPARSRPVCNSEPADSEHFGDSLCIRRVLDVELEILIIKAYGI